MVKGFAAGVMAAFAALPALAGEQAARPAKAPAAEALLPCPSQGLGFARVPGSRTCLRISGHVATGIDLRAGRGRTAVPTTTGRLAVETRTESDFGPVRTYVRIGQGRR